MPQKRCFTTKNNLFHDKKMLLQGKLNNVTKWIHKQLILANIQKISKNAAPLLAFVLSWERNRFMVIFVMNVSSWISDCTGHWLCRRAYQLAYYKAISLYVSKTSMVSSYYLVVESSRSLKLWMRSTHVPRAVYFILCTMTMPPTTAIPFSMPLLSAGRTYVVSSSIGPSYT